MADEIKKEGIPVQGPKEAPKRKPRPPKKVGHVLPDKRPHFKSFKSPGVK